MKTRNAVIAAVLAAGAALCLQAGIAAAPALAEEAAGERAAVEEAAGPAETATEKLEMKVNQVAYLSLKGDWTIANSNTKVVKVGKDGSVTAKAVGKATLTLTGDGENETIIVEVTVAKSNFKPVAMKKLQCYKAYRKYMTEAQFKKAYSKALKLVTPAGDLSKKEQLQYVTWALRDYFDRNMSYTTSKPHYNDPYGYLCLKRASCAGCARTTGLCLNILGIKFEHVNENKWTHQWCRVKVGSSYWIADPYGMYCGKEPAKRKHPYL